MTVLACRVRAAPGGPATPHQHLVVKVQAQKSRLQQAVKFSRWQRGPLAPTRHAGPMDRRGAMPSATTGRGTIILCQWRGEGDVGPLSKRGDSNQFSGRGVFNSHLSRYAKIVNLSRHRLPITFPERRNPSTSRPLF